MWPRARRSCWREAISCEGRGAHRAYRAHRTYRPYSPPTRPGRIALVTYSPSMAGRLLIVGTPLGNLSDMTPRAVEALKSADLILCEDTRHTRKLLTHFGIDRPTDSYHDHNEDQKAAMLADRLE